MTDVTDVSVVTETAVAVADEMTKEEAATHTENIKAAIEAVNSKIEEVSDLLTEASDRKAWKALGYRTWEEYVTSEFHMSRARSYRLINQAKTMLALEQALGDTTIQLPPMELDGGEIAAIKEDVAAVATEIRDDLKNKPGVPPEEVAEIIHGAIQQAKARKAARKTTATATKTATPITPVQTDEVVDAEIVDGEIVDGKATYMGTAVTRLIALLEQLKDFPEPEELAAYVNDIQFDRICKARTWLMRFPVEIPG